MPVRSRVDVIITPEHVDVPPGELAIVVTLKGAERLVKLLVEDVDAALPPARFEAAATVTDEGATTVTVTAETFLRSVTLFADRVAEDAWADSAMVDLFPGESHTFVINGAVPSTDADQLTRPPALRSLNDSLVASEAL